MEEEEIGTGDRMGKYRLLDDRVYSENQSSVCLVERRQVVHPGVATLDGRVAGDERQEDKVAVEVRVGELMMCNEWFCKGGKTEGRRQRGGVSYSLSEQTLHVSTPTWQSRSLLWPNTLSIRSGTCVLTGSHSGIISSQSHTLLLLLLKWEVELGSSSHGLHFLCMV